MALFDREVSTAASFIGMTSGAIGGTASGVATGFIVYDHWGIVAAVVLGNMVWGAAYAAITFLVIFLVEALSGNL